MTQWKAEQEEIHRQKFESYPENLKALIKAYEGLDDAQKKVFGQETLCHHSPYDDYKNPQTTKEDLGELLEILIQDTIDFIKERGLKDIDGIGFGVDGLQSSAKYGEWTPSSDANIYATGIGTMKGTDGDEYKVIQNIGELLC